MRRAFAMLMLMFVTVDAGAWQPYPPDVTQERFEGGAGPVDHLLPFAPEAFPSKHLAEFGAYPSFSPAYEWRLFRKDGKYILSAWALTQESDRNVKPKQVDFVEKEVPEEVAALIYDIWTNALLESRYSRNGSLGLDGTTYRFSTYLRALGWMQGKTWSPDAKLPPKWLVECGELVHKFSRSSSKDAAALNKRLSAYRRQLYSYWRSHGRH